MYRSYRTQREQDIKKAVKGLIFRTAKGITREARAGAPKGVSGALRRYIHAYLEYPVSIVTVLMPYAKYVEGVDKYGARRITRRHFTPWYSTKHDMAGWRLWGRRHGFEITPKGGLFTWGYNIPFFSDAIKKIYPRAMMDLRRLHL